MNALSRFHDFRPRLLVAPALIVALGGCAGVPRPTAEIAASRAAIESADVAGAGTVAAGELAQARDKYDRAQAALLAQDNRAARRYAEESTVDAQLAQAKASTARVQQGVVQANEGVRVLREEVDRAGSLPAGPVSTTPPPSASIPQ
jgi:hypothetical protein